MVPGWTAGADGPKAQKWDELWWSERFLMNNYTAMTKFGLGSPARDWRLFRRFLSLLALALVVALAGLLLTGGDSARVQAQTPSDLTFGDAEFPDLYFVKGSAGDVAPFRGLPQAFQGEGAIRYELVRFSDNAAAPAWIGWDPSVRRGIQPQLDAYRDLRVQYKAIDESGTIAAAIFDVFVGPPQPFPVTTYSGTNRISVLVPNDNIPISHDVDIRRSDNGGRTWGAFRCDGKHGS